MYTFFQAVSMRILPMGGPGASREEVVQAAKLAGAHEFIEELKDGYDTYVGERGVKLSGGQNRESALHACF